MSLFSNTVVFTVASHNRDEVTLCGVWSRHEPLAYVVFDNRPGACADNGDCSVSPRFRSYEIALRHFQLTVGESS